MWLDDQAKWDVLAGHLRTAGEFGYDTETYGQPDKTSPQHRARIHCFSVGVLTNVESPRGYRRATGRVLPRVALDSPALRSVFADPKVKKYAHNAPHDRHSTENEGVEIRGLEDTLQWARVTNPGLRDYGLKESERRDLGYPPRPEFWDLMKYKADVVSARGKTERGCICGARPCRAKSSSDWLADDGVWRPHLRVEWRVFTPVKKPQEFRYQVPDFVPGAVMAPMVWEGKTYDRLAAFWEYSLADAVRGMELVDWLRRRKPAVVRYPWESSTKSA